MRYDPKYSRESIIRQEEAGKFRKTKFRVWEEIPKEETYKKYGDASGGIEIGSIEKHGAFARMTFSEIPDGGL